MACVLSGMPCVRQGREGWGWGGVGSRDTGCCHLLLEWKVERWVLGDILCSVSSRELPAWCVDMKQWASTVQPSCCEWPACAPVVDSRNRDSMETPPALEQAAFPAVLWFFILSQTPSFLSLFLKQTELSAIFSLLGMNGSLVLKTCLLWGQI